MDYSYEDLQNLQAQSIDFKLQHCINMIAKFYHNENGKCYLSYSGGKDSTVLKWIIHTKAAKLFPELLNIPVVYFDTGLEYPEVKQFVKSDNNIIIRRPEINFFQCILKYGYPVEHKILECTENILTLIMVKFNLAIRNICHLWNCQLCLAINAATI